MLFFSHKLTQNKTYEEKCCEYDNLSFEDAAPCSHLRCNLIVFNLIENALSKKREKMLLKHMFEGDISYENFIKEYLHKKPCVLGKVNGGLANQINQNDMESLLSNIGISPSNKYITFINKDLMDGSFEQTDLRHIELWESSDDSGFKAHEVRNFLKSGGSIKLPLSNYFNDTVKESVTEIEQMFKTHFRSSLFYNHVSNIPCFEEHIDNGDFFAVQYIGEKHWKVRDVIIDNPYYQSKEFFSHSKNVAYPDGSDKGEIILDFHLKAGQVLYCPKGFPHEVKPCGVESLHIDYIFKSILSIDFYKWLTSHRNKSIKLDVRLNLDDLESVLSVTKSDQFSDPTIEEIALFKQYLDLTRRNNASRGFIPQLALLDRFNENSSLKISYCPIAEPIFKEEEDLLILIVNTDEFNLEPERFNQIRIILNLIYLKTSISFESLNSAVPQLTKKQIIDNLEDLHDFGIINVGY